MKVYIASPLFNESELENNRKLRDFLRSLGFETYLPQEDCGTAYDLMNSKEDVSVTRKKIFDIDIVEVKDSDIILCVLDGRVPDEGVCIELGVAYSLGKICIGYSTDRRSFDKHGVNLMIEGCLQHITHSKEELETVLKSLFGTFQMNLPFSGSIVRISLPYHCLKAILPSNSGCQTQEMKIFAISVTPSLEIYLSRYYRIG